MFMYFYKIRKTHRIRHKIYKTFKLKYILVAKCETNFYFNFVSSVTFVNIYLLLLNFPTNYNLHRILLNAIKLC